MFISVLGGLPSDNIFQLLREGSYRLSNSRYVESWGAYDVTSYFTAGSLFIFGLLVIAWVPLLSISRLQVGGYRPEVYALVVILLLSCMSLMCSVSLLVTVLSLELVSFCSYILVVSKLTLRGALGGWIYAISGGLMSLFTLFGSVLLIGCAGTPSYGVMGYYFFETFQHLYALSTVGTLLVLLGFIFKLAAAPYYNWTPDVYAAAPTAIVALLATVVKFSIFVAFFRLVLFVFYPFFETVCRPVVLLVGCLSLLVGSVGGLRQAQVKRVLAYSSIAHVGFILVGLSCLSNYGLITSVAYMLVYILTSLGVFAVLVYVPRDYKTCTPIVYITDLSVLKRSSAFSSVCFVSMVLSLLGMPPFAGFFVKYGILYSVLSEGNLWLAVFVILAAVLSSGYYLRLIQLVVFSNERVSGHAAPTYVKILRRKAKSVPMSIRLLLWLAVLISVALIILPVLFHYKVGLTARILGPIFGASVVMDHFHKMVGIVVSVCQCLLFSIYIVLVYVSGYWSSTKVERLYVYLRYTQVVSVVNLIVQGAVLVSITVGSMLFILWWSPSYFFLARCFPSFFNLSLGEWWLLQTFPV